MQRTLFVLLSVFVLAISALAQTQENVTFRVVLVDKGLNLKNVPKHVLIIRKADEPASAGEKVVTSFDGTAKISLPAGEYLAASESPVVFEDKSYAWQHKFTVKGETTVELSSDNAKIETQSRKRSEVAELFRTLRNGVVTVEGEISTGSGFIFDPKGLVLTNYHVIAETNDIRVRFDAKTAVRARLLAKDEERDLAVLQINLAAFPASTILKLAETNAKEPPVSEGEQVFSIGSPAHQEKILTTGIVSRVLPKAIISDINFNAGSSGGPLFNSLGEVVGVATFKVKEKKESTDSGLAGIVRIEETGALIAQARALAATKGTPSAELMPNVPDGTFPVETIKTALRSPQFASKEYVSDVKDYQVRFMTPVYKFYMIEKDRIESLKIRERRNKDKGKLDAGEMFRDLSVWNEYAGELKPVVDILALPETSPTMKSMALSVATNLTVGYSTPLSHKYKADFSQMKLLCDNKEVVPVRRSKTEIARELQDYYKTKKRFTYAGVYTYPYDIFAPGRCGKMEVHVFSEEDLETPIVSTVTDAIKARIWNDFNDFRNKAETRP